jgi:hypothetical protein
VHGRGYRFVAPLDEILSDREDEVAPSMSVGGDQAAAIAADAGSPIRYTQSDGLNIAYQITGAGDVDLVLVAG